VANHCRLRETQAVEEIYVMTPSAPSQVKEPAVRDRLLPSGRSVVVKVDGGCEELEIRSPEGAVELHIVLTETGPVVRLSGARLELSSPDAVAVHCRRFDIKTSEGTTLASDGTVEVNGREMRVQTTDDVHLDGRYIRLNCPKG
jgi:hypothetical protein